MLKSNLIYIHTLRKIFNICNFINIDKKIIKLNIPLLYKLNKWILVENKEEINKLRKDKLNQ